MPDLHSFYTDTECSAQCYYSSVMVRITRTVLTNVREVGSYIPDLNGWMLAVFHTNISHPLLDRVVNVVDYLIYRPSIMKYV